ncbi:hypothetical protein F4781DRAFT_442312 [Annulohypoxylon bovei var. microspora]|nr:hypothetical protein F4781DRAFT_442312 [Annulohypoxylon bovei var. microspora]
MSSSTSPITPQDVNPSLFQWNRSKSGIWERDIDECETFYKRMKRENNDCYPIIGCASFVIKSPETMIGKVDGKDNGERGLVQDALLKAWEVLCYEHPTLRSRIEHDKRSGRWKRVYSTFKDGNEQKNWLSSTFKVIHTELEPLRWFNNEERSFDTSNLLLVSPNNSSEHHQTIFLRCPHDVTDGVGILQLIDQLFGHAHVAYDQGDQFILPVWGSEHMRLSPCLRLATTIPESSSEAQLKRFKEIQVQNGSIYTHPGLLSLPPSSRASTSQYGKRHRVSILVSKATTEQIILKCKAISSGVSVTHLFMAALATALSELQPQKRDPYPVCYVNHSMINLRPYCRDPYTTPEHAAAPYHTVSAQALGVELTIPSSSADARNGGQANELPEMAIKVRDFYKEIRPTSTADEQVNLAPLMFKSLTAPPGSDPHGVSDPPFCPVVLSSLGNIASIVSATHGTFEITSVWAASEALGAGVAIFLGTWDGKIELSSVFDTRYHDAGYITKFLKRIFDCVFRGLGIDGHASPIHVTPAEEKHEET